MTTNENFASADRSSTESQNVATDNPIRSHALKLSPPADHDLSNWVVGQRLAVAIEKIFNSQLDIELIEYLSYPDPADQQQTYVLQVCPSNVPDPADTDGQNKTLDNYQDSNGPVKKSLADAAQTAKDNIRPRLPDWDMTISRLDLDGLGISPVTTARLVISENRHMSRTSTEPYHKFSEFLQSVPKPHIYQVIFEQSSKNGGYNVSVRVALFGLAHQVHNEKALAEVVNNGRPYDPADTFESLGLSSSFRVAQPQLRAYSALDTVDVKNTDRLSKPSAVRDIAYGHEEYHDLLNIRSGYDKTYKELGYYGRTVGSPRQISHLIGAHHKSYETSPWTEVPRRSGPQRQPPQPLARDTPRPATNDVPGLNRDTDDPSAGDTGHENIEALLKQAYGERGWDIHVVDQSGNDSIPDLMGRSPDGEVYAIEAEAGNSSSPAAILTNVIRADRWGLPVIMAGETRDDAATIVNALVRPFESIGSLGAHLYTAKGKTSRITTEAGTHLLPQHVDQSHWWLNASGQLTLRDDDDTVLARGSAETSVASFEIDTPCCYKDSGSWVVEATDGTVLHRYDSKRDMKREWSYLHEPLVPTRLTYVDMVTVKYGSESELRSYDHVAGWDQPSNQDRHEEFVKRGFEVFTVEDPGSKLPRDPIRRVIRSWYGELTQYSVADKRWFGRSEPDWLTKRAIDDADEKGKQYYYQDRAYRYPRGIVSPMLPDISDTPPCPDDWL